MLDINKSRGVREHGSQKYFFAVLEGMCEIFFSSILIFHEPHVSNLGGI